MNWDTIAGNWKTAQGKVREQWGKLTDDDLDVIAGKRDQLIGSIQERYGKGREEVEGQPWQQRPWRRPPHCWPWRQRQRRQTPWLQRHQRQPKQPTRKSQPPWASASAQVRPWAPALAPQLLPSYRRRQVTGRQPAKPKRAICSCVSSEVMGRDRIRIRALQGTLRIISEARCNKTQGQDARCAKPTSIARHRAIPIARGC